MARNFLIILALVAIVGLPFLLRPKDSLLAQADETLVIITPHIEAIRYEYSRAFRDWYKARTGKTVRIDWRDDGNCPLSRGRLPGAVRDVVASPQQDALERPGAKILR